MNSIAMRCTLKDWLRIKPKLELISGINYSDVSEKDFDKFNYLVTDFLGIEGRIANLQYIAQFAINGMRIEQYDSWDESKFLEACGYSDGWPERILSAPYIVKCNYREETNKVACYIKGKKPPSSESWCYYPYVVKHDGILGNNHKDNNLSGKIEPLVDHLPILSFQTWESLIDIHKSKNLNKQIKKEKNKSMQKLKVPVADVLKIHAIACSQWKTKIISYLSRIDSEQNIQFSQSEIDAMFEAASMDQQEVLIPIFGKKVKEIDFSKIKTGSRVILDQKNCGKMISDMELINFDKPVDVVFFNTPHLIENAEFKSKGYYTKYCTFHQNGKYAIFSAGNKIDYIKEVLIY
jgi:hypothetical protein